MASRRAVLLTPSLSSRPVHPLSCTQITRETPLIPVFVFKTLRTLSFSVAGKSCVCHSYANGRGGYQQFPTWNESLAACNPSLTSINRPPLVRCVDSSSPLQLSTFNCVSFPSSHLSLSQRSSKSFTIRTSKTPLPQLLYNPHLRAPLGSAGNKGLITPLESALTKNSPVTSLESALTKTGGWGPSLLPTLQPSVTCPQSASELPLSSAAHGITGHDSRFFSGGRFPQRKQRRLRGRSVRDGIELRVMLAQRFGNFDFCFLEDVEELQSVNDGFALEMIIRDHKCIAGALLYFLDPRDPGSKLFGGIEIVISFLRRNRGIVAEPGIVAPPVQPHVAHGRGRLRGRRQGAADKRLVDVAEAGIMLAQESQRFGRVPRAVTHFDDKGIIPKPQQNRGEIRHRLFGAMEGKRELKKDGAEFVRRAQNVEPGADRSLVCGRGARSYGDGVVGEFLPEFCGEDKARVGRHALNPLRGMLRAQRLVKRGVDLDGIEEFREIGGLVKSLGTARRINVASPVWIRPARGAHAERAGRRSIRTGIGRAGSQRRLWLAFRHEERRAMRTASRVEGRERKCQRI